MKQTHCFSQEKSSPSTHSKINTTKVTIVNRDLHSPFEVRISPSPCRIAKECSKQYCIIKSRCNTVMSHCTTHSFKITCCGWKVGMADHMMHSLYNDTMYPISTISDILHQGVNSGSLVKALDFYPSGPGSNPFHQGHEIFSNYASFLIHEFSYL